MRLRVIRASIALIPLLLLISKAQAQHSIRDLEYALIDDVSLKLDLYLPSDTVGKTFPLIVWVHGGGWSGGDKAGTPATRMVARGYVVASVNYRLSGVAKWPAQINDCKGAIRWLRANAAKYHIDLEHVGVWGSSAGGHLVAMLGTSGNVKSYTIGDVTMNIEGEIGGNPDQSSGVQAVCDWYGPSDFLRMSESPSNIDHDSPTSPESNLLGGPILENPERSALASPITYITLDDPPFLIMHGTRDMTVPFTQSVILDSALRASGIDVSFRPMLDAGHGGGAFNSDSAAQIVNEFFDLNLKAVSGVPAAGGSRGASALSVAPNPASSTALVSFAIAQGGPVTIELYTSDGRRASTLLDADLDAGDHLLELDATRFNAGPYVMRLRTSSGAASHRMMIVR